MSLILKTKLADAAISYRAMAQAIGSSKSVIGRICEGQWPTHPAEQRRLRAAIEQHLTSQGIDASDVFDEVTLPRANATGSIAPPTTTADEDPTMLLRKQVLTQAARAHFRLSRDPFIDCREPADVYLSADIRYVREAMWSTVRHGGFLAVVGESGAGKSTLREELLERLQRESPGVIVIQPYVLAMEDKDTVGKTLRSQHIAEALVSVVAPLAKAKSSPEARFKQLHEVLRDSARTGAQHVLVIEEAHCLPIPTLKHLKRYLELKDGMRPLLSIILLGQPELALKLSEQNPEVREVVQRIEVVTLPPLDNGLAEYLRHRFQRAGANLDDVIDASGIDALRARLTPNSRQSRGSLLYPLAVHNAMTAALNAAAELGAPKVTRDLVGGAA